MQSRRSFLKKTMMGAGALALGPSFGDVLAQSVQDGVKGALPGVLGGMPRRFIFIRKSNGTRPKEVALPTLSEKEKALESNKEAFEVDLRDHELPIWLQELDPYKSEMCILQGLSAKMSENGHASYSSVMGAFKSGGNSISGIKRATIDFELAKLFPSPFGHVELALRGDATTFATGIIPGYSAPAPHQRNYCYADPETAYNELFKVAVNRESMNSDEAMLRFLRNEENFKASVFKGYEKLKMDNHLRSIESIQQRNKLLQEKSSDIAKHLPQLGKVHKDGGKHATTMEKQEAMTEVLLSALITGLTNVVTYTIDELGTPMTGLPGNEGDKVNIHEIGHGGGYGGVHADKIRENVRIRHMKQVARIVERLKEVPEGNGTMFDNTMILYFPENGETHHGLGIESPFVMLAGSNCQLDIAGQYIRLPFHATEGHKTIGNLYTTLLNAHGNPIEHYGDMDVEMDTKKLKQTGSIDRLWS